MTVKELIEKLQTCDPDKKVIRCKWVPDSEYDEVIDMEHGVYFQ